MKNFSYLKFVSLFIFLVNGLLPVSAQQSMFTRVFYDDTAFRSVQVFGAVRTPDLNYLFGGYKDWRPSVIKMDQAGNIIWSKSYSDSTGNIFCLTPTNDSGFLLAGNVTNFNGNQSELLFLKINQDGNMVWFKIVYMGNAASAFFISQTSDHGFIAGGNFEDSSPPYQKSFVMKLDSAGNLGWCKAFSSPTYNNATYAAVELSDGNFIVTGSVGNGSGYSSNLLLMKLSPAGSIIWSKRQYLASNYLSEGNDLKLLPDGILCYFTDENSQMALMKIDTAGTVLWSRAVGYEGSYAYSRPNGKMCPTTDGGYLLMNASEMYGPFGSLVKVDSTMETVWARSLWILPSVVIPSFDSGFIVTGNGPIMGVRMSRTDNQQIGIIKLTSSGNSSYCITSNSFPDNTISVTLTPITLSTSYVGSISNFQASAYAVVLKADTGCVAYTGGIKESSWVNPLKVIPNPSNGEFRFELNGMPETDIQSLCVYNSIGEMIFRSAGIASRGTSLNFGFLSNGIYEIRVMTSGKVYSQKIIIIH
ncbi:MAG: T9SS type A sorting domain-containing protein [Bacteroidetes bacterium]|nr:T9SS type A sorting domain-containing protein [Bacteroidota bacterium]